MQPLITKRNWRLNFDRENRTRQDQMRGKKGLLYLTRQRRGLSQAEAAALAGVTQSAISRAEASGDVSFMLLERLAYVYDVGLDHFATKGKEMQNSYKARSIDEWLALIRADKHLVSGFDLYFADARRVRGDYWEQRERFKRLFDALPAETKQKWEKRASAVNLDTPEPSE